VFGISSIGTEVPIVPSSLLNRSISMVLDFGVSRILLSDVSGVKLPLSASKSFTNLVSLPIGLSLNQLVKKQD